ncbi:MAG: PEGA domain-containing protein [Bacteroidetes bacterium]|nr:PEGA domain-containing protein [Bacteroidota bacterium]
MKSATYALLILAFVIAGCATIMHGTTQDVSISSQPTGATITIDGQTYGTTPVVADLKRKDKHMIRIELEGYEPYEIGLGRKTSGWVWGNIVFGGLIGLAVDAITGGLYKISPDQVEANLRRPLSASNSGDMISITVVLNSQPGWERIGQLQQTN